MTFCYQADTDVYGSLHFSSFHYMWKYRGGSETLSVHSSDDFQVPLFPSGGFVSFTLDICTPVTLDG